jgi:hypothetical protein
MVDFKRLVKKETKRDVSDLLGLFDSLDRQTSHIELRPVQQEALAMLSARRSERDLILKISTGAGKTTVALLYLASFMEQYEQPVAYLCPTRQLTDQVCAESQKLGIKAIAYPAGQPHPDIDCISAKAILVCTYDKLFNAKTTFNRTDVMLRPCAFVLDDAHAGVEEIRDSFTLNARDGKLYHKLLKALNGPCGQYKYGVWADILKGDPNQSMEVPYWVWKTLLPEIEKALSDHTHDEGFKFVVPYVRDILRWCRCVVSGNGIEIVPEVLPVHKSEAFIGAKHRLFMSATLADDSVLVRELGCDVSAASNPVLPSNDRGLGERMVVAPSLVGRGLDRRWVMSLCEKLSKKVRCVVLSPREQTAREWESFGATVCMGDDVTAAVEKLKQGSSQLTFAVFVQRYDGIDLPDNACRVLVLDGMPLGEGIVDKHDSSLSSIAGGTRNRLVYRIEQGMGRAVRSHADYAVILLVGPELAHFIAKHEILSVMNQDTQAQLRLALDIAKLAMDDTESEPDKAVVDMIVKCLSRDVGWKQFYNESIRSVERTRQGVTDHSRLMLADAERRSFESALANDQQTSVDLLRGAINKFIEDDKQSKGWYLQRVANYLYDIDPGEALEVQRSAFENNKMMVCPPSVVKRPLKPAKYNVQAAIMEWFKQFENPNGAIAAVQELRVRLSFDSSPANMEQALCDLAHLLGAQGSRPEKEYGEGPDDLWLWPDVSLVIEAKNQNQNTLHKDDAGQLLISLEWFKKKYPTRTDPEPVVVAKVSVSDLHAGFPDNTMVITPERMNQLLGSLETFFNRMAFQPLLASNAKSLAKMQEDLNLTPRQIVSHFTVQLEESKK